MLSQGKIAAETRPSGMLAQGEDRGWNPTVRPAGTVVDRGKNPTESRNKRRLAINLKENSYIYSIVPGNRLNINLKHRIMKRLILLAAFVLTAGTLAAQNYIIVNSEKVFKSVDAYNTAISTLDKMAEQYQAQVDAKFAEIETLYNNYMNQKASLTATTRQTRENAILAKEKEAQDYQEALFGNDGTLMKKRVELIEPIQKKVFAAIEAYAKQAGADIVLDSANNPMLLYTNPRVERTQQVIDALK